MKRRVDPLVVTLERGDITRHAADAIVNAANGTLLPGGGVCGAIHGAGGPSIAAECDAVRRARGDCPTGAAVATGAGDLPARFVFHAVGPVWRGGAGGEKALLASAYRACLGLADEKNVASIAFPSISTGIFGYPIEPAARTAIATVRAFAAQAPAFVRRVTWVLFDEATFAAYRAALGELS